VLEKNKYFLVLLIVSNLNTLFSQKNNFIGTWIEYYNQTSYEVLDDDDCCGIDYIDFEVADKIKVDRDSIYLLRNDIVMKRSNYKLLYNETLSSVIRLQSDFIDLSSYGDGIETSGRGLCDDWTHYIRQLDNDYSKLKKFDSLNKLVKENKHTTNQSDFSYYLKNGESKVQRNMAGGYVVISSKPNSKIKQYTFFDKKGNIKIRGKFLIKELSKGNWNYHQYDSSKKIKVIPIKILKLIERKKINIGHYYFNINNEESIWRVTWEDESKSTLRHIGIDGVTGEIIQDIFRILKKTILLMGNMMMNSIGYFLLCMFLYSIFV